MVVRVRQQTYFYRRVREIRLFLQQIGGCVQQLVIFAVVLLLKPLMSCLTNQLMGCCPLLHRDRVMVDIVLGGGNIAIGRGSLPSVVRYIPGC